MSRASLFAILSFVLMVGASTRAPASEAAETEALEVAATYRSHLAGAPDGEYVIIRFNTSYSNKADAQETVTPMLDPDGQWRVSGFYIK